jgi:hypothetical protein
LHIAQEQNCSPRFFDKFWSTLLFSQPQGASYYYSSARFYLFSISSDL